MKPHILSPSSGSSTSPVCSLDNVSLGSGKLRFRPRVSLDDSLHDHCYFCDFVEEPLLKAN